MPVNNVEVEGADSNCSEGACRVGESAAKPGEYKLKISSPPSFKRLEVTITIEPDSDDSCCACGYTPLEKTVVLERDCREVFCDACEAPIVLSVVDANTGAPIDDIMIDGTNGTCNTGGCSLGMDPGEYTFTVSAPGYAPQQVNTVVEESLADACCDCGYQEKLERIALEPL